MFLTTKEFAQVISSWEKFEIDYISEVIRPLFNQLILFSARYDKNKKVIPFDKIEHLNLGIRKYQEKVCYHKAFNRFLRKLTNPNYSKKFGLKTLKYIHQIKE